MGRTDFTKPAVPMCSGIAEMVIRICVIVSGLPVFGFAADKKN